MSERRYGYNTCQVVRARCAVSTAMKQDQCVPVTLEKQANVHGQPAAGFGEVEILPLMAYVEHARADLHARDGSIFDVLNSSSRIASKACAENRDTEHPGHESAPLMTELYERYCESLISPFAVTDGTWVGGDHGKRQDDSGVDIAKGSLNTPVASILGDINTTEEAFGILERFECSGLNEAVPEILTLFAPPEHRAISAKRGAATPPELTRREHHAVSLDSPMWSTYR